MSSHPAGLEDAFRDIMANFAASVTVVTSYWDERHHGLTVSAFTSVSLDPPLVLICIDHASHSIEALREAGGFTVNMLREGTADLALRFASKDPDKFRDLPVRAPRYEGAGLSLPSHSFACLECRTVESAEAGDHTIFIGQVEHAARYDPGRPLLYWQRDFRRLQVD
ncbi:flavin reductase family protein [Candidatus Spongiisocius sp.]|uniref:flavin reductase family protein n=1 Tax=Candidatus Spongiisocius sp. TaxID=3101273 RepID=UPI003B5C4E08